MPDDVKELSWVRPGEIDGEPDEVRSYAVGQLQRVFGDVGQLVVESVVQLRGAGITGLPGRDSDEVSLEAWIASEEGVACRELIRSMNAAVAAVRELQRLG